MTTTLEKTNMVDEFEKLLNESFSKSYSVADIVEGTVMKKDNEGYLISVRGAIFQTKNYHLLNQKL